MPTTHAEETIHPSPTTGISRSIGAMIARSAEQYADAPAILVRTKGSFTPTSYRELYRRAVETAAGLLKIGIRRGDRVAILSENRPEWLWVDLACQLLGATDVPIYPNLPSGQVEYILSDSGCSAAVVSDRAQYSKVENAWPRLPDLRVVVTLETDPQSGKVPGLRHDVRDLATLVELGKSNAITEQDVIAEGANVGPDDLCSVVYTSGTTGNPKGAMLSHGNFLSNILAIQEILRIGPTDVFLSFLPLNHVFERMAGYYFPLSRGSAIAYAESPLRVKQNLPEVQPTVLIGVPRLYDGLAEGLQTAIAKAPENQQKLLGWAMAVGRKRGKAILRGKSPCLLTRLQWRVADRLALEKVRTKMGCARLRYFVSGSAPLSRSTAEYLLSVGLEILEGYGLTETSPVLTVNHPGNPRPGSVGCAIPGIKLKIADDGEILGRGPNIMKGYLNKPVETAEAIDADGWFHTGDIGRLDDGHLYITDRKKDLIVLGTGKKVAPQPIEAKLKASPYIKEAVVLGDRMSYCIALVVPVLDRLREYGADHHWSFATDTDLCSLPEARKLIRSEIDRLSPDLAEFERIRNIALLEREFSIESGELTPTLKVKRKVVMENYAGIIEGLVK